jgi:DNA-binding MarR family transcriptional regulator
MRELDQLAKELPNLDFALRFPEAPGEKLKGIQLGVEEWRVVSFINPKNSIRQIAKACNMTDMEIRRIVYSLLNAGLVELVKPVNMDTKSLSRSAKLSSTMPQRPVITKLIDRIKNL